MYSSDEEDFALLMLAEAEEEQYGQKKERSVWVRQHFRMRPVMGEYYTTFKNLMDNRDDTGFF